MPSLMQTAANFLGDNLDFCLLDCGSAGGPDARWHPIINNLSYIGFDGNAEDCRQQNARAQQLDLNFKFINAFLGGKNNEQRAFQLTSQPDTNSLYPLNFNLLNRFKLYDAYTSRPDGYLGVVTFPRNLKILGTELVTTQTLDTALSNNTIKSPDFMRIDLEGAELEVMKGGEEVLNRLIAVEIEVVFTQVRDGAPLFCEIDTFMKKSGFVFHSFEFTHNAHFAGREASPVTQIISKGDLIKHDQIRGQWVTADALYIRDPYSQAPHFTWYPVDLLKLIIIYASYNYIDAALEVAIILGRNERISGNEIWANKFDLAISESLASMGLGNVVFSSKESINL